MLFSRYSLGVPLRVGLSVAIFLCVPQKRIFTTIPHAKPFTHGLNIRPRFAHGLNHRLGVLFSFDQRMI